MSTENNRVDPADIASVINTAGPAEEIPDTADELIAAANESITPLTIHDRCDQCGAQAYVRVTLGDTSGVSNLLFCGHHGTFHEDKLRAVPSLIMWHDERDKLLENAKLDVSPA